MNAENALSLRPQWTLNLSLPPLAQSALVLLLTALLGWWIRPVDAPLTQLQLRGAFTHLSAEDVRHALQPYLAAGFFKADVAAARATVADLPWVAQVRVERRWPGALSVRVSERRPYSRWNDAAMLDTEAQPFAPRAGEIPPGLPLLAGTPGSESEVAQGWQRLSLPLMNTPLQLAGLGVDARGEWTALTVSGIELRLGQGRPDRHLASLTGAVLTRLDGRWGEVGALDLRYSNGFAVGWREAESTGTEQK